MLSHPCSVPIGQFGHQAGPTAARRRFLQADRPLPDKYRFLLFDHKREVELVWNGKTGEVSNVVLPFQVIVTLLSSFVRRVDFNKPEVGVEYTVPVQLSSGLTVTTEVLNGGSGGSPMHLTLRGKCVWARFTFLEPVPYRPKSKSGPPSRRKPITLAHEWHDLLTNDELCSEGGIGPRNVCIQILRYPGTPPPSARPENKAPYLSPGRPHTESWFGSPFPRQVDTVATQTASGLDSETGLTEVIDRFEPSPGGLNLTVGSTIFELWLGILRIPIMQPE